MITIDFRRTSLLVASTAVVLFCYSLSSAAPAEQGEIRTWRDAAGRFAVEAKLLKTSATHVQLRTADGREIAVPIDRLSEGDRKYLANLAAAAGAGFAKGDVLANVRDGLYLFSPDGKLKAKFGANQPAAWAGELTDYAPNDPMNKERCYRLSESVARTGCKHGFCSVAVGRNEIYVGNAHDRVNKIFRVDRESGQTLGVFADNVLALNLLVVD